MKGHSLQRVPNHKITKIEMKNLGVKMYYKFNRIEMYTPHEQMVIRYDISQNNYIDYDDIPREQ